MSNGLQVVGQALSRRVSLSDEAVIQRRTVPKMTYAADIWYTPVNKQADGLQLSGLVGIMGKLALLQRMATLAITGMLCSTATDLLDLHANVLPVSHIIMASILYFKVHTTYSIRLSTSTSA